MILLSESSALEYGKWMGRGSPKAGANAWIEILVAPLAHPDPSGPSGRSDASAAAIGAPWRDGACYWLTRLKRHDGASRRARRRARFGLPPR